MNKGFVIELLGPKLLSPQNKDIVLTPENISIDMISMWDESIFNPNETFIDLYCKSGVFLKTIYNKLMQSKYMIEYIPDEKERHEYILENQLFGVCAEEVEYMISVRNLYGTLKEGTNIKYIKDYDNLVNNTNQTLLWKELKEVFNMGMKFDHVVMNPPYNKGMDLDFIDFGYKVASKDVAAIVPAKWQTTADDYSGCASKNINYKQFREKYVPHMREVVFYPCCRDVFEIYQTDGITYFIIDKNIHKECKITNKCNWQKAFNNSIEIRDITSRQSLYNIGNEIEHFIGIRKSFRFSNNNTGNYEVWSTTKLSVVKGNTGLLSTDGNTVVTGILRIEQNHQPDREETMIFASNSESECKSFSSYINTKLVRFLVLINISKLNGIWTDDYFRFVPAPPSEQQGHPEDDWNHIYTDEELYEYFGLNKPEAVTADGIRYRDIIDAVIKERK